MNPINWKPKALKQAEKIKETAMRQRIYTEVQALADFPNCQGVKKLTSHAYIGYYAGAVGLLNRYFFRFHTARFSSSGLVYNDEGTMWSRTGTGTLA